MPPAPVVPVEDAGSGSAGAAGKEPRHSCHVAWLAWWAHARCILGSTLLFPCHAALGLSALTSPVAASSIVRGTLFLPSTGDRRVRLFLQEHHGGAPAADQPATTAEPDQHLLVLDLPAGLGGADIAASGRIVLEHRRQWAAPSAAGDSGGGALLDAPRWLVYCNGRRAGYAARRGCPSDAEGWVLEKLRAVTAGAGRLPGCGGVEYLRGRFRRVVGSPDAESFHLVEPSGWLGVNGGGDGGLSIFFHRV
ncbi:hypothetical protein EJB05_04715, partial [Eragrostis curvula]